MNPEIKQAWIDALTSGEYEQGKGSLLDNEGHYCCLGVLCDLALQEGVCDEVTGARLSSKVSRWSDLASWSPMVDGKFLINLNDNEGKTFEEIAKLIHDHL